MIEEHDRIVLTEDLRDGRLKDGDGQAPHRAAWPGRSRCAGQRAGCAGTRGGPLRSRASLSGAGRSGGGEPGSTRSTRLRVPRLRPAMTRTSSPFLILSLFLFLPGRMSNHLGRQRDDPAGGDDGFEEWGGAIGDEIMAAALMAASGHGQQRGENEAERGARRRLRRGSRRRSTRPSAPRPWRGRLGQPHASIRWVGGFRRRPPRGCGAAVRPGSGWRWCTS